MHMTFYLLLAKLLLLQLPGKTRLSIYSKLSIIAVIRGHPWNYILCISYTGAAPSTWLEGEVSSNFQKIYNR